MFTEGRDEQEGLQVVRNGAGGMAVVGERAAKKVAGFVEEGGTGLIDMDGGAGG